MLFSRKKLIISGVMGASFLCGYEAERIRIVLFRAQLTPAASDLSQPEPLQAPKPNPAVFEPAPPSTGLRPEITPMANGIAERRKDYEQLFNRPPEVPSLPPPPVNPYEQLNAPDNAAPPIEDGYSGVPTHFQPSEEEEPTDAEGEELDEEESEEQDEEETTYLEDFVDEEGDASSEAVDESGSEEEP